MILDIITQKDLEQGVYYSKWHTVNKPTSNGDSIRFQDLTVGELVGPILNAGNDSFIILTYLTELVDLTQFNKIDSNPHFIIWERTPGTMYLENKETGIRFNGYYEGLSDKGDDGISVYGTSCLFTTEIDEAYVETWFKLINYDKSDFSIGDEYELSLVPNFLNMYEDYMREYYPERIISLKL